MATAGTAFMLWSCGSTGGSESDVGSVEEQLLVAANCPPGFQVVQGTAGNDVIDISVTPNRFGVDPTRSSCVLGLGGNDTITTGNAIDWIAGGAGNDTIHAGGGADYIFGETGDDTMFGDDGNDYISGDDGNDTMNGGNGDDQLFDGRGNDFIHGDAGNDWLQGGADDDQLFGDDGNDTVDGGTGNNTLFGGAGNDLLQVASGAGINTMHGDDGNDICNGGTGPDTIEGGNGNDTINGNAGDDILWGDFINNATATTGTSVDTIHGNDGNDALHGGPGNDVLFGDNGVDNLSGDDGDDRLNGGANGAKTITGGNGNDLEKGSGTGTATGDNDNDAIAAAGTVNGGAGSDACTGTACELTEPATFCTSASGQCASGQRCATEVNICIFCQSDSECTGGALCVPTVGCSTKETVCNDGIDNDHDTKTDCADTDCAQDPSCQVGVTFLGNSGVWHNCITNKSGVVKCWGRDNCSQLGYFPTGGMSSTPTAISFALAGTPKLVRGGSTHTCALLTNGTVQCWGNNTNGQLGGGTTSKTCSTTVTTVTGLSGVTQLASGGDFSCAVMGGGVKCWGQNNFGQLGNNTTTNSGTPVAVQGLTGTAIDVKTGTQNACALLSNGAVNCWGRNEWGQLGNGTTTDAHTATTFGVGTVAQVAVSGEFTCARLAGGRVFCAGVNYAGQLGIGTSDSSAHATPVAASNVTDASDVASGWFHTCIIRAAGAGIKCWGKNTSGQIGNGTTSASVATPVLLALYNASNVSAGMEYTCVRHTDGTEGCWGINQYGQLGDGTLTTRPSQVSVHSVP